MSNSEIVRLPDGRRARISKQSSLYMRLKGMSKETKECTCCGCIGTLILLGLIALTVVILGKTLLCTNLKFTTTYEHTLPSNVNSLTFNVTLMGLHMIEDSTATDITVTEQHKNMKDNLFAARKSDVVIIDNPHDNSTIDNAVVFHLKQTSGQLASECHVVLFTVRYPAGKQWHGIHVGSTSGFVFSNDTDVNAPIVFVGDETKVAFSYMDLDTGTVHWGNITTNFIKSPISTSRIETLTLSRYFNATNTVGDDVIVGAEFNTKSGFIKINNVEEPDVASSHIDMISSIGVLEIGLASDTSARITAPEGWFGAVTLNDCDSREGTSLTSGEYVIKDIAGSQGNQIDIKMQSTRSKTIKCL
ncbi:hypothetical protein PCE1_002804 [Barthelona sp. PCE]